tara:strand:- start:710 stop:853 length:144 start_codon:yes stop_codon:yes gene_type:complete
MYFCQNLQNITRALPLEGTLNFNFADRQKSFSVKANSTFEHQNYNEK